MADTTSLRDRACDFAERVTAVRVPVSERSQPCAYMASRLFQAASAVCAVLDGREFAGTLDVGAKHAIALREAKEARYWLRLLTRSKIETERLAPLEREADEFVAILTSSIQRLRETEAN